MQLDPYGEIGQPADTLFRDVLSLALLGFLAIIVLLLPHLNPTGRADATNASVPGNVIVEITWPDHLDADIDLWVKAPDDVAVGYSNKGSLVFNLLRDDLGKTLDLSSINHETAYTRGIVSGEYVINAHAYRLDRKKPGPVRVQAVVSVKQESPDGKAAVRPLLHTSVILRHHGEELTLARFTLTEDGTLLPGSVHSLYKRLRKEGNK